MRDADVNDLEKIEINIDTAKKIIEFGEALKRLEQNPDWKKIIEEDFFNKNISRLVKLKAHPGCQDEANQGFIARQINAVGEFEQYLVGIRTQANHARNALDNDILERENILNQGE